MKMHPMRAALLIASLSFAACRGDAGNAGRSNDNDSGAAVAPGGAKTDAAAGANAGIAPPGQGSAMSDTSHGRTAPAGGQVGPAPGATAVGGKPTRADSARSATRKP